MATAKETIIAKLTSARFWVTILTTWGASLLVAAVSAFLLKKNETEAAVAVLMAYIAIWKEVVMSYFGRSRPEESNGKPPTS